MLRPFLISLLLLCSSAAASEADFPMQFGRGVNLGNALEMADGVEWAVTIEDHYFDLIAEAGFQHVRVPVRWSLRADEEIPYTIDPAFFERVDAVLDMAEARNLAVVLNIHHYNGLDEDPEGHTGRFLGLWRQIAERYADRPNSVAFELHNEPHNNLTDEKWNFILVDALNVVRRTNPDRWVIIGGAFWNNWRNLEKLELPDDDRLVATFHYYDPFKFTHQGADWVGPEARAEIGQTWMGTEEEKADVRSAFDQSAEWAKNAGVPLYLGEFGSYGKADMESRARWTQFVREEAERLRIPWAYWEFGAGFGIYDRDAGEWREPLKDALVP